MNGAAVKRGIDLVLGSVLLVLCAPALVVVGILIRRQMGSPVLFRQPRVGEHGAIFPLWKFRTMRSPVYPDQPDEERITPLGQTLRRWSLDELPELVHVVSGRMSLVGPRPLLPEYLPRYTPRQALRHTVPPGITGWAQVNGRNATSWEDRLEMDAWYVEHRSLALDVRILLMTVGEVLRGQGVSAGGHATMPKFQGNAAVDDEDSSP